MTALLKSFVEINDVHRSNCFVSHIILLEILWRKFCQPYVTQILPNIISRLNYSLHESPESLLVMDFKNKSVKFKFSRVSLSMCFASNCSRMVLILVLVLCHYTGWWSGRMIHWTGSNCLLLLSPTVKVVFKHVAVFKCSLLILYCMLVHCLK